MSREAYEQFDAEAAELQRLTVAMEDVHPSYAAHLAKRAQLLARVALTFHALAADTLGAEISGGTMALAVAFLRRQERHAWAVYSSLLGPATGLDLARAIGRSILAGGLTLGLLVMPMVVIATSEALRAVPSSLRHASYALGATKWQTVRHQVLPVAFPGILTGMILALSRAIGETAPILLIGGVTFIKYNPEGLLSKFTVLPIQIYSWVSENDVEFTHVASAAILVLLAVLAVLYGIAYYLRRGFASR